MHDAWKVFHRYNELVGLGIAKPLTCQLCERRVQLVLGPNDEPAFQCFWCDTLTIPGQNWYDEVKAVVMEYYE